MKSRSYYWTVAIIALLLIFVVVSNVIGIVGFFIPDRAESVPEVVPTPAVTDLASDPEAPVEPEAPADPEAPVEPEAPADPEAPVEPEVPVDPETPVAPEVPVDPEEPVAP